MRRIRVGMLFAAFAVILIGQSATAWGLTAADQAFLKKKIIARWNITGKNQIAAAYARGVDILEDHPNAAKGYFEILVSADELDNLRADGYSIDVVDPDWYQTYANKTATAYGGFHTWDQAAGWPDSSKLDSFHTAFPTLTTQKVSIGFSIEGRELWAMKISDNPNVNENEPSILFTAIHHAREPITVEVVLHTMRTLLFNYGTDSRITNLVNEREIWFIPFVNPDGYVYNEVIASNGGGMWRKNRREIIPEYGVDPNRNYGDHWGFDDFGSSPFAEDETYRGSAAFSEPEIQAVRDFVDSNDFVITINYHSVAGLFLWAPGYQDFYTPDEPLFKAIGDTVTSFNGYNGQPGWGLYNTNGDADDWYYFAKGVLSFTPEVGGSGFWPNASEIPGLVNENVPANLVLIDLADTPARIYPPAIPTWVAPGTVNAPDYSLVWSDPGGLNAAATFKLTELAGRSVVTDLAEMTDNWNPNGFLLSETRAYSLPESFWGGSSNNRRARLVANHYYRPIANDTLRARMWYNTEANWDYAYAEVSADFGQTWATLPGTFTTNTNPNGTNRGNGITGSSGGTFRDMKFSLNAYAGSDILFRFSYETDGAVLLDGVYIDNIYPVVSFSSEVVLDPATPNTTFPVTGKTPGTYYYTLRPTDVQGQVGGTTPPHEVVVDYVACDCTCHADPSCDGNVDILDVVETVSVAFRNVPAETDPTCPRERTDVDCNNFTDILDVVNIVEVAFRNASPAATFCSPCTP